MFRDATSFNQVVAFDTSSVTDMQSMFNGANSFDQVCLVACIYPSLWNPMLVNFSCVNLCVQGVASFAIAASFVALIISSSTHYGEKS